LIKNSHLFPKASKKYQYLTFGTFSTLHLPLKRQKSTSILAISPHFDTKSPVCIVFSNKAVLLKRRNSINEMPLMTSPIASEAIFLAVRL
jgi:hypothetical protein